MKKLFLMLFILPLVAMAQPGKKDITHTVGPKESLSSIGRLYNINGRDLANYNNIDYNKGLSLGQVLKIPAKNAPTGDVFIPPPPQPAVVKPVVNNAKTGAAVYHTVEKKQTLYAISKLYGVTIADIKKWNNLTADALSEGAAIIVGYNKNASETETKPVPVVSKQVAVVAEAPKPKKEESPAVKKIEDEIPAAKEVVKEKPVAVVVTPAPVKTVDVVKAANYNGGVFKTLYDEQTLQNNTVTETGIGGVFKSSSGWDDGKYYCLHNNAMPGTIIKIVNTANGKVVYAKVLDGIPDIKQNNDIVIRLSNAAANALGNTDGKLNCTLTYLK
jgi:LysM repeat protein